jgi:TATA-box binding protein (TBP) (component of TFIID and TFIIIB)
MSIQDNIKKAKEALSLIDKGENPLDNYEMVKAALKESDEAIDILWEGLSFNMIEELKKDKECNNIIKAYKKEIELQIKEVAKDLITYKYKNTEEYEKFADNAKDTPLTRRTKFIYEVVWPILSDLFDKVFFEMNELAEAAKISRLTATCPECNNITVYRKIKGKMVCTGCGVNADPKDVQKKTTNIVEAVVYDMAELPNSDAIARQMAGVLDRAIEDYMKEDRKRNK